MPSSYSTDIVIFGGGVAGLWLLNRLAAEGYRTILLEQDRLGGGQSINSQGIIHGGLKYALHGAFSGASRAIADMPRRWRGCIEGQGEIDLSACRVLSPHFLLWSGAGPGGAMKAFLGSKAVAGKAKRAQAGEIPQILRGRGAVYALPDFVLDAQSLIGALALPHRHRIHSIGAPESADSPEKRAGPAPAHSGPARRIEFNCGSAGRELILRTRGKPLTIRARRYIFCAGEGNRRLIEQAGLRLPRCQTRPLKMVSASGASLPPIFLHVLGEGLGVTPALTVTSHRNAAGAPVWYLGGALAEAGTSRSDAAQIQAAKCELADLLPTACLNNLRWRCLDINRAEPASSEGRRPDNAWMSAEQDIIVAWPTKLALAPVLADLVVQSLCDDGIRPRAGSNAARPAAPVSQPGSSATHGLAPEPLVSGLPGPPPLARPFWN